MNQRISMLGSILLLLMSATGVYSQDARQMPNFVLRPAQDLNARFGVVIDLNNVIWDYTQFSATAYDPAGQCPDLTETPPPNSSDRFYIVVFQPVLNGSWGHEVWKYLVYGDLSFMTPCMVPQEPFPANTPTMPHTPIPRSAPVLCNPQMPSRLAVGQWAQVTPGFPNNVRANPGASSNYVGEIPPEDPFFVLSGPECASGMAWWQVDYNGLIGWTPEGETVDDYWLEPIAVPITASNAHTLQIKAILPISEYWNIELLPITAREFVSIQLDGIYVYQLNNNSENWQQVAQAELPENTYAANLQPAATTDQVLIPLKRTDDAGGIQVLDAVSGQVVFATPDYDFVTAAVSPDGSILVGSIFEQVFLWHLVPELSRTEPHFSLPVHHTQGIGHLVFSPDGSLLAAADSELTVIWDTQTWEPVITIPDGAIMSDNDIAISPDNTMLAITGEQAKRAGEVGENFTRVWDIQTSNRIMTLQETNTFAPRSLAFNSDGSLLAVAGGGNSGQPDRISLWNLATGELAASLQGHTNIIMALRFSPDGGILIAVDQDRNLIVWAVLR